MAELVYLSEAEQFVPARIASLELADGRLRATVEGHRGEPKHLVKGVTLHRLALRQDDTRAGTLAWCSMSELVKISEVQWEIPASARSDMRVPARVFADRELLAAIEGDGSLEQIQNVATLPGVVEVALAMPDVHQGYGFPVGGVAAMELPDGVVSPGGVGYDINCGVRLLALPLGAAELGERRKALVHEISRAVPACAGKTTGRARRGTEVDAVLRYGPRSL